MAKKTIEKLSDLTPDQQNFNRHTEFGSKLLEDSLRKFGAGRSILVDKNGNIIAGNGVTETAASIGMEDVIVVPSDGKKIVVVQRTDLELDSPEGRELALADNMTALKGIDMDLDKVKESLGEDMAKAWGMFNSWDEANADVDIDSLFEDAGKEKEDKLKITIEVPLNYADNLEDIKSSVKLTLDEWEGCKVK